MGGGGGVCKPVRFAGRAGPAGFDICSFCPVGFGVSHILQRCFCLVFLADGEVGVEVAGVADKAWSSYERARTAALSLGWCSVYSSKNDTGQLIIHGKARLKKRKRQA